ncbi:Mor transcription activator family protein [Frischella perrara]|uniref:Mor transcription activator family n=2 Tax=Frischella perrara TaxID=1267021 RepID=A0A0A7S2I3_FRIPE|nr:Mor transcription activator family protein [Frischella perrara]AJA45052.1 Mor transcription activator family [Frischella perrara]PWV66071.1 Mor transcription activator family protein [Frischella perrara]
MAKSAMSIKRHHLLTHIALSVTNQALDFGLSQEVASQLGDNVANTISELFGGQNFTFPRDHIFKLNQRDLEIYAEFRGNNYNELSNKYNMTERGIRKVIDRIHKRQLNEK